MKRLPTWWIILSLCSVGCELAALWAGIKHGGPWLYIAGVLAVGMIPLQYLLLSRTQKKQEQKSDDFRPVKSTVTTPQNTEIREHRELLVWGKVAGSSGYFTLWKNKGQYYFMHLKASSLSVRKDGVITRVPDQTATTEQGFKRNRSICFSDVERLLIKRKKRVDIDMVNSGQVVFYTPKPQVITVLGDLTPKEIDRFFSDMDGRIEINEQGYERQQRQDARVRAVMQNKAARQNEHTLRVLRGVNVTLIILAALTGMMTVLLAQPVHFWPLVSVAFCVVALVLPMIFPCYYAIYPSDFSNRNLMRTCEVGYINPQYLLMASGFFLVLRTLLEYHFVHLPRLVIVSIALATVVFLLLEWRLGELRLGPWVVVVLAIFPGFFGLGALGQINGIADPHEPTEEWVSVIDTIKYTRGYAVVVRRSTGEEIEVDVDKDTYYHYEDGGEGMLVYHKGALQIPYVEFYWY